MASTDAMPDVGAREELWTAVLELPARQRAAIVLRRPHQRNKWRKGVMSFSIEFADETQEYQARIKVVGNPGSGCSSDQYHQFDATAFQGPTYHSIGDESGTMLLKGCVDHTLDLSLSRTIRRRAADRLAECHPCGPGRKAGNLAKRPGYQ